MNASKSARPWVEILFALVVGLSGAAFYTRGCAFQRWTRGETMGNLGPLSWLWALAAFLPFAVLVRIAPNPELAERVPPAIRHRQILMFIAILIIFGLEIFLLSF